MTDPDEQHLSAPALLRRLARDTQIMGPRLAQLEYQLLAKELENPNLFDLELSFEERQDRPPLIVPNLTHTPMANRAPVLNVTLGKTAWSDAPDDLPAIGIYINGSDWTQIRLALAALLKQHYISPFARFVFLSSTMRPIPFLGRYEFTYEYIATQDPRTQAQRLKLRFGLQQIRDLTSGREIWRSIPD